MKSILIPTDFSKAAQNAVNYAAAFCKDYNLDMHLLHVMHAPAVDANATVTLADTLMDNKRKSTREHLQKIDLEIKNEYGVDITIHAEFGLGSEVIIQKSEELDVDLVVMGASGETGLLRSLFGSVTEAVVSWSKIPILAVPKEAKYSGFGVAVLGKDYKENIRKEMVETYHLLTKNEGRLDVISVEPGREEYSQEVIVEEGGIREVSIWASTSVEGLKTYLQQSNADLLVLKHHNRNFIQEIFQKSTTKELLKESTIPLYIFN